MPALSDEQAAEIQRLVGLALRRARLTQGIGLDRAPTLTGLGRTSVRRCEVIGPNNFGHAVKLASGYGVDLGSIINDAARAVLASEQNPPPTVPRERDLLWALVCELDAETRELLADLIRRAGPAAGP